MGCNLGKSKNNIIYEPLQHNIVNYIYDHTNKLFKNNVIFEFTITILDIIAFRDKFDLKPEYIQISDKKIKKHFDYLALKTWVEERHGHNKQVLYRDYIILEHALFYVTIYPDLMDLYDVLTSKENDIRVSRKDFQELMDWCSDKFTLPVKAVYLANLLGESLIK